MKNQVNDFFNYVNQVRLVSAIFLLEGILLFLGFDTGGSRSFVEATPKSASFFFSIGLVILFLSEYLKKLEASSLIQLLGTVSLIILGTFVFFNPKFSGRGGTTDLSYMNLNILVGLLLISLGLLLFWNERKKSKK